MNRGVQLTLSLMSVSVSRSRSHERERYTPTREYITSIFNRKLKENRHLFAHTEDGRSPNERDKYEFDIKNSNSLH